MMDIEKLKFDEKGLIPAIVQDANTGVVLMQAYMNRESLEETLKSGKVCFLAVPVKSFGRKGRKAEISFL